MKVIFFKLTFLLALLIEINCQRPSGSLNDLIGQEFQITGPATYESCATGKICVAFYNCNNNTNTVITDGENLLDIRFNEDTPCASYLDKCCSLGDPGNKDSGLGGGGDGGDGGGGSTVVIPEFPPLKPPVAYKKGCGYRNVNGLHFKISGNTAGETEYAEFPWMIAVLKQETVNNEIYNIYECGGSIIHPQVVMTAAHCVRKYEAADLLVRAGEWDTQTKEEPYKEQDRQVIEMILHEKFSKAGLHNDIALLFVNEPFIFGADVNSVCLPPPNHKFGPNDASCFVTGWGKDQYGLKGKYQVILKKVAVPIVPFDDCQNKLQNSDLGKTFKLHESFICAGGEGKDACKGDGGGPLSCPIPNEKDRFYQSGIVAWGIGCDGKHPSTYASTSYLRDWIDQVMDARGFDTSHYTP